MPGHHASVGVRLLLILALIAGTIVSGLSIGLDAPAEQAVSASGAVALAASHDVAADTGKTTKKAKRAKRAKKNSTRKKRQQPARAHGAPAALDSESIAAAHAETVDAFDCGNLIEIRVDGRVYCTHGEDPPRAVPGAAGQDDGVGIESAGAALIEPLCLDNGVTGPRVQIVYVHRNDRPSRLTDLLPTFRRLAAEMDIIFDQSARKTGGSLRVRFVTDGGCQVAIPEIAVPPQSLNGFGTLIQKMHEAGYNAFDRKYLMLVDERIFCGAGTFNGGPGADSLATSAHDFTGYARVDTPCWDSGTMAHEISHTLGGVQYSAPHASGGAHCIDEWDVMCYSDQPFRPKMQFLCAVGAEDFRLDCNNDDYFAARPAAGSYLASHWNIADSIYLTTGEEQTCVDAFLEPDDPYWYDFWDAPLRHFAVGTSEQHAFCKASGDTDWALFRTRGGATYRIETTNLVPGLDTQLVLYRGFEEQGWRGMELVGSNDNRGPGDPSSALTFTAPGESTYLVGVSEAFAQAGFDKTFTLSIAEVPTTGTGSLSLSRQKARRGGAFTAMMYNIVPHSAVTFWWQRDGQATRLGEVAAGDNGIAEAIFKVPGHARRGSYQVEAVASDTSVASATLKLIEPRGDNGKGKGNGKGNGKGKGKGKGKKHGGGKKKHGKGKGKGKH